jgi:uncharacterized protein (DUF1800 family)
LRSGNSAAVNKAGPLPLISQPALHVRLEGPLMPMSACRRFIDACAVRWPRACHAALLALTAAAGCHSWPAVAQPAAAAAGVSLSEGDALHLLDRLAFGPAPGDLQHVMQVGADAYIDEQLHPERTPLPAALTQQLAGLPSLALSEGELVQQWRDAERAARTEGDAGKRARREWVQRIDQEAGRARLLRAVESPHQLEEVMVEFWFNHFNVFEGKGLDRVLVANYEREAIRPYALGRFRDLLGATAHHPAMLFYLDNWLSTAPGFVPRHGPHASGKPGPTGLNENYARELMELHTLGVDGGYSQHDVTELARILTGWRFDLRHASTRETLFVFDARRHDPGDKEWRGRHVGARGQAEGEWALDVLARDPATAHHLAFELAQYFVADQPPPSLVDRLAQRYLATDGDIREVLKTLFDSREFRDPAVRGAKFKTPYRFVVSAMRASGQPVTDAKPLLGALRQLGMPLYGCPTPDGYKNTEDAWLNPDAITRRVSLATLLGSGRGPGGSGRPLDADALLATLGDAVSPRTRAAVARAEPPLRAALVLGSPDFMRH